MEYWPAMPRKDICHLRVFFYFFFFGHGEMFQIIKPILLQEKHDQSEHKINFQMIILLIKEKKRFSKSTCPYIKI